MNERDFKIILPITRQKIIDDTAVSMSKQFGGVTMLPLVRGMWVDERGKLIKDDNILLFSSRDLTRIRNPKRVLEEDRKFMTRLALAVGKLTDQDSIWVEEDIIRDVNLIAIPKKKKIKEVI